MDSQKRMEEMTNQIKDNTPLKKTFIITSLRPRTNIKAGQPRN
jgi:hypothetical protein